VGQQERRSSRLCRFNASINLRRLTETMSDTSPQSESKPASAPAEDTSMPAGKEPGKVPAEPPAPDPTRYGDWEKNGRCIDF